MASRVSPGGALLRTSRMFSIPKPIPAPPSDTHNGPRAPSPSATTSFPQHLSITTPSSSRIAGDWGFKRPFPLSSTNKSSTPLIRVKQIDTIEHVTDFASSSDHALSLEKFQELNLSITMPSRNQTRIFGTNVGEKSVFEEDSDFTALPRDGGAGLDSKRWKFSGPWLAGLTEGEFIRFLKKKVRNRRSEFRLFLKGKLAAEMTANQTRQALDRGQDVPAKIRATDISEQDLTVYLRRLRSDRITLYGFVSEFLDLAPLSPPTSLDLRSIPGGATRELKPPNPYAEEGPPITHPSAGLSYLRTTSVVENHPIYGPQQKRSPVLARILSPRQKIASAKLGVGGFVTDTPQGDTAFNVRSFRGRKEAIPGVNAFDPDIEGGAKVYVSPVTAKVKASGNVIIDVGEADPVATLIHKEMTGKASIYQTESQSTQSVKTSANFKLSKQREAATSSATEPQAFVEGIDLVSSSKSYGLNVKN
jgi:hypothetical protein